MEMLLGKNWSKCVLMWKAHIPSFMLGTYFCKKITPRPLVVRFTIGRRTRSLKRNESLTLHCSVVATPIFMCNTSKFGKLSLLSALNNIEVIFFL